MAPGVTAPAQKSKNKPEFSDEDLSAWNPDHMGERKISEKKLRKTIRSAEAAADAKLEQTNS
jgi:tRNA (adenine57-N1/adenine58-N1)-methyltransferase